MYIFNKSKMLLPSKIDLTKWSVIACDQYTSEPKYWNDLSKEIGDSPSTLNIVFPEIFLEEDNGDDRIKSINETMHYYIDNVLEETESTLIYVERTLANGKVRKGVMGIVDLEEYDFSESSTSKIRGTEGTVLTRIPPRVKIRQNAPMELPHIMVLIDDDKKEIIEGLNNEISNCKNCEKVYDFDLSMNSGKIKGYKLSDAVADNFLEKLNDLDDIEKFNKKYDVTDKSIFIYAVGDGNHSLATAKTCYENLKKQVGEENAQSQRYALVELVNLHDDSLEFDAIHRMMFDIDTDDFISKLREEYILEEKESDSSFKIITKDGAKTYSIANPDFNLTVACLQNFIDKYLENNNGKVDYIHGESVVNELSKKSNCLGIVLKSMRKDELFKTVILDGVLPRKTFSMGVANEKRFYLEGRKIK